FVLLAWPPLWQAFGSDWQRRNVSTEEQMARWLEEHVPPSDPILLETAIISLPPQFHWRNTHRLIHDSLAADQHRGVRYLVASSDRTEEAQSIPKDAESYRQLFAATQIVYIVPKSSDHPGPALMVLKVPEK